MEPLKRIMSCLSRRLFFLVVCLQIVGCMGRTQEVEIGDHVVFWSSESLRIETVEGRVVFESVTGDSVIQLNVSEDSHEYGSGSFTFMDTVTKRCGKPEWKGTKVDEGLKVSGVFPDCDTSVDLAFSAPREGWLQLRVETEGIGNRIRLTGASTEDEFITGFGAQYSAVQFNGREVPIWCQEQGHGRGAEPITELLSLGKGNPAGDWHTTYSCVPWMIRDTHSGVFVESPERSVFDMRPTDRFHLTHWSNALTVSWISGESLPDVLRRYTAGTGRMTPFPAWSQNGVIVRAHGGVDEVASVVSQAEAAGVSVAAVWIEDWCGQRQTSLGTRMLWNWDVDRVKYPTWEEMVAELGEKGIRVLAYINPYLVDASDRDDVTRHLFAEALASNYLVRTPEGDVFWMEQGGFDAALVDLTNPAARLWLQSVIEDLIETGVSGWMADFAEGLPLEASLHAGDPSSVHNQWPALWADVNQAALESKGAWADSLVFHRSGNARSPGTARGFWLGDQLTTWDAYDGLSSVIPGLLTSGLSGYSMQHADTGGYLSVSALGITRDAELFQRWVELSALTPLFRMHSTNQPSENHQWNTDAATEAHLAKMTDVYVALAPYRETVMGEAQATGLPVIRPLFLMYPEDDAVWPLTDQFLLGSDVLVAPVLTPGAVERTVYLPAGQWIHGVTSDVHLGGQSVTVQAPIGAPAVFVRVGADLEVDLVAAFLGG